MAPYRGRARPAQAGKLARSGIRTRGGQYKKFDSQRTREVEVDEDIHQAPSEPSESEPDTESDSEEELRVSNAYTSLLESLKPAIPASNGRPHKRRKLSNTANATLAQDGHDAANDELIDDQDDDALEDDITSDDGLQNIDAEEDAMDEATEPSEDEDESIDHTDPYEGHFAASELDIAKRVKAVKAGTRKPRKSTRSSTEVISESLPEELPRHSSTFKLDKSHLKQRLQRHFEAINNSESAILPYVFNYVDVLCGNRTTTNAASLRQGIAMHAVNHILKGRDKVLKNNARLSQAADDAMLEFRDQGFTRPKVLILMETRQMCAKYADAMVEAFSPEQQENRKRFNDAFTAPIVTRDMPEDYSELFEGNNDNNFITTIKFTRKTLKFYSAFYQSDIILASPLGLRRIIEHDDKRKRDHDFLSSIEVLVIDQADAMLMQSWENVEIVLKHINLQPKELRDCDVNRVRHWYLDENAKYLRQTIVLSGYITPDLNKLYNSNMLNVAGKVSITKRYAGAIQAVTGLGVRQMFLRFSPKSPVDDPDSRFKFFTTLVLPVLLRLPRPSTGGQGTLIFIPSYFDFLRIRNFFATSTVTENISFGAISDYSEVSDQRRARSHFVSGKHSILLYTQRAHHFFRIRLRGVKNVTIYQPPDNELFYREVVGDFLSSSIQQGSVSAGECTARTIFSKYDALRMERVVGTDRVRNMLSGAGDTFDFI